MGNAVPPPLARSIGLEIRKSLVWQALQKKAEDGLPSSTAEADKTSVKMDKETPVKAEKEGSGKQPTEVMEKKQESVEMEEGVEGADPVNGEGSRRQQDSGQQDDVMEVEEETSEGGSEEPGSSSTS